MGHSRFAFAACFSYNGRPLRLCGTSQELPLVHLPLGPGVMSAVCLQTITKQGRGMQLPLSFACYSYFPICIHMALHTSLRREGGGINHTF